MVGVVSQYTCNAAVMPPDATSASAAAARPGTHRGHWKITQYMYRQVSERPGGGCSGIQRVRQPDSGTFRIRWRSPGTTRLRLYRRLPARTGAVQVDVGVAGAVRVPALGTPAPGHVCPGSVPAPGTSGRQYRSSSLAFSKPSSSRGLPCPVRRWRSTVAMNSSIAAVTRCTGVGSGLPSVIRTACHCRPTRSHLPPVERPPADGQPMCRARVQRLDSHFTRDRVTLVVSNLDFTGGRHDDAAARRVSPNRPSRHR